MCACVMQYVCMCHAVCVHVSCGMCACVMQYVCMCHAVCVHVSCSMCACVMQYVCMCHAVCVHGWSMSLEMTSRERSTSRNSAPCRYMSHPHTHTCIHIYKHNANITIFRMCLSLYTVYISNFASRAPSLSLSACSCSPPTA